MPLTDLQVVELQRDVPAQKLATERQAAAAVQAKIGEKVAEELKNVAPTNPHPVQPIQPKKQKPVGTATWHLDLVILRAHRGGSK